MQPVGAVRERPGEVLRRKRSALRRATDSPKTTVHPHNLFLQLKPSPTKNEIPSPPNTQQQRVRVRARGGAGPDRLPQRNTPATQQQNPNNPPNPRNPSSDKKQLDICRNTCIINNSLIDRLAPRNGSGHPQPGEPSGQASAAKATAIRPSERGRDRRAAETAVATPPQRLPSR